MPKVEAIKLPVADTCVRRADTDRDGVRRADRDSLPTLCSSCFRLPRIIVEGLFLDSKR